MSLNLNENSGPISLNDPDLQNVFADLQGNILNGHGRDQAFHLFLKFNPNKTARAKSILASLAQQGYFTSAQQQLADSESFKATGDDGGLFVHFALAANGYRTLGIANIPAGAALQQRPDTLQLGVPPQPVTFYEKNVFEQGMKARNAILQDSDITSWDRGFQDAADALIIVADDSNIDLINAEKYLRDLFGPENSGEEACADILTVERGFGLRRQFYRGPKNPVYGENVEHFGYVDGRSQPALLDVQLAEDETRDGTAVWNPVAPPKLVLITDPNGANSDSFGSFLVFRKLEQNVHGFKSAQRDLAQELGCPLALAGAMAVGRFEDGTPVVLQPGDNSEPAVPNDFDYSSDKDGRKCPFHAHIRKTNPRLESVLVEGGFAQKDEEELGHRIARRGIPYGGGLSDFSDPETLPKGGVGLLFMCYQSDIWEQFEFQQRFWSNNEKFVQPGLNAAGLKSDYALGTGMDAIIGQQKPSNIDPIIGFSLPPRNWPNEWGHSVKRTNQSISQFVTLKGGEYFFSPSISSIVKLSGTLIDVNIPSDMKQLNATDYSEKIY